MAMSVRSPTNAGTSCRAQSVFAADRPATRDNKLAEIAALLCSHQSNTLEWLPTVLRSGPYRFFFYSADHWEPPHVHVEREEAQAKFWFDPVRLASSRGFGRLEIRRIETLVADEKGLLLEAWHEYFGN